MSKSTTVSEFRFFVLNKYYEYQDELDGFNQRDRMKSFQGYFRENKWFLKSLYRSKRCRSNQYCGSS